MKSRYLCVCEVGKGNICTCPFWERKATCQNNMYSVTTELQSFDLHYSILFINFADILSFILLKMRFEEDRPHSAQDLQVWAHAFIIELSDKEL